MMNEQENAPATARRGLRRWIWRGAALAILGWIAAGWLIAHIATSNERRIIDEALSAPAPIVAMRFHADWCGNCRVLAPKWAEALQTFEAGEIQAVTVDLTFGVGAARRAARKRAADAPHGGDVFDQYGDRTGFVVLYEAATGRPLEMVDPGMDPAAMTAAVEKARDAVL